MLLRLFYPAKLQFTNVGLDPIKIPLPLDHMDWKVKNMILAEEVPVITWLFYLLSLYFEISSVYFEWTLC